MKRLTIALLLSIAPAAINAEHEACITDAAPVAIEAETKCGTCDKAEEIQDDRCCGLAELALIDAALAHEATSAMVTITGYNDTTGAVMSAEGWIFVTELLPEIFGAITNQTENSISFVLERSDMTTVAWFETLAIFEAKLLELKSIVEQNPNCVGGTIAFGLTK